MPSLFRNKILIRSLLTTLGAASIMGIVLMARPRNTQAQLGSAYCDMTVNFSQSVPVYDQATQAHKNVVCTGNGIMYQIAHVFLQQLTNSVVNWINSGYQGSPSFVTDPESFFLDAADQATGAFISDFGPLKQLCSPFSLDIRLSLALGVTSTQNQRYTCTLSKIIQTQQGNVNRLQNGQIGSVSVSQNAGGATLGDMMNGNITKNSSQLSVNGQSGIATMDGFMSGDFNQGGLPGLLALTTEPQNNPYGASLQAQSDLQMQILAKQNTLNNDLNRGSGFLSWQKCNDVQGPTQASAGTGGAPQTKQVCHTETPGSVISASLNKSLGAPTDQLNLADSINEVVGAVFSSLVTKVLSNGLLTVSQPSSSGNGTTQSYVDQLSNDPQLNANLNGLKQQTVATLDSYATPLRTALAYRTQALGAITAEQAAYASTRACIADLSGQTGGAGGASASLQALDALIASSVTPQVTQYQSSVNLTQNSLTQISDMEYQLNHAKTAEELQSLTVEFSTASSVSVNDAQTAKIELDNAGKTVTNLQKSLAPYQSICNNGGTATTFP